MKDINVMINEITENLMDVTGYEKALDIRSVLYMHLSGYQLSEACTDVSAGGVAFPEAVRDWGIELQLNGCTEETLRTYAYNVPVSARSKQGSEGYHGNGYQEISGRGKNDPQMEGQHL